MRALAAALIGFLAWATCVWAQAEFPARYQVKGVSANDTLNVRAGPGLGEQIIGDLAPDARNVEVLELSANGSWGKIGWGERNGWVGMRFMALQVEDKLSAGGLPRPMRCLGTEPFWALTLKDGQSIHSTPSVPAEALITLSEHASNGVYLLTLQSDDLQSKTVLVEPSACSDGMSDRDYGLTARLFEHGPSGNSYRRGCCTLDSER